MYPSKEYLRSIFNYENGNMVWLIKKARNINIGDVVGTRRKDTDYIVITVDKVQYRAGRIVWIWHNGDIPDGYEIDHKNHIRYDNQIENLRLVTCQENQFNRGSTKGYYFNKANQKYQAKIRLNGEHIHLGCFVNESDARQAYLDAKEKYHIIS